jgi:hypothetical protein
MHHIKMNSKHKITLYYSSLNFFIYFDTFINFDLMK